MLMYDIITKKKLGKELTKEEINFFINGYVNKSIPDYQVSSLLMSIWFNKLNMNETILLTEAMINSGDTVDISDIQGIKVDKHSTGGVGDKTSLVLLPILASNGLKISKMSGRGLGHTGGTLDKLESIEGFQINLSEKKIKEIINKNGFVICGQTSNLVPADKKLYSLRDVTATVDNIQLIASSIMSKKIASGADYILLDVKVGNGAFMKNLQDAVVLSKTMVAIGDAFNKKVRAVITNMYEPLGRAVGNSLEVIEAVETLKGNGPNDFTHLCLFLAANIFHMTGVVCNMDEGLKKAENSINSGKALRYFETFINLQHGNAKIIKDYCLFDKCKYITKINSIKSGNIQNIDAEKIGKAALLAGAGREKKEDNIQHSTGVVLYKKTNEEVSKDDCIAEIHTNKKENIDSITKIILSAFEIDTNININKKLIYGIVDDNGFKEYK